MQCWFEFLVTPNSLTSIILSVLYQRLVTEQINYLKASSQPNLTDCFLSEEKRDLGQPPCHIPMVLQAEIRK
jgi:hypothetical protein